VGDGFDEAAGARLGSKSWWRLVHGQQHADTLHSPRPVSSADGGSLEVNA